MRLLFKGLLFIFSGALVLIAIASFIAYFMASNSLPNYNQEITSGKVDDTVEIVRDVNAIPHIFGKTDKDIYFGLGLAHAQDRLWQMTMLRRTSQGRLSEIFGKRTLKLDRFMRQLDLYGVAKTSVSYQSNTTQEALQAYADGVNSWLKTINENALGRGAPEFFLFSSEIAPWTPADSLAIARLMALQLSDDASDEIKRAQASLLVSPDRLKDLFPDTTGTASIALPEFASLLDPVKLAQLDDPNAYWPLPEAGFGGASNAWAANPSRTVSKSSLLATDPHLALSAPSIWMLAALYLEEQPVIGGTIPGIPVILIGRNNKIGWGLTTSNLDSQDIFIEKLGESDKNTYVTPEGLRPFKTQDTLIEVKDHPTETLTLRWSRHGPIISDGPFDVKAITPPDHVASLSWTGLDPKDRSLEAWMELMQASSVEKGLAKMNKVISPSQNLIIADKNEIAMQMIGAVPNRKTESHSQGRIPSAGWTNINDWDGYQPFSKNPQKFNPQSGIVANTNNRISDKKFPDHIAFEFGDTERIRRLTSLLNQRQFHTMQSFIEAQNDTVSITARTLLPLIGKDLWFNPNLPEKGTKEEKREKALNLLASWNGDMNEHLPEPAIYASWLLHLNALILKDELADLYGSFRKANPVFIERVFNDTDGASIWCDIRQTPVVETCTEISIRALDEAIVELEKRFGGNVETWRWGDIHMAIHQHEVLGTVPILKWFFNIYQSTSGGDNTLQRAKTTGRGSTPYHNVHAAGFRAIYDFNNLDNSLFIISTGQSGHFLSKHYDDLSVIWRRGEYIQMTTDPELARSASKGITKISPE